MTRGIWVMCSTQEQAERLRRAGYNVTSVSSGPRPRPSAPRRAGGRGAAPHPAAPDDPAGWAYCLADLRASKDGRRLGRECGHDARVLARRLGLPIEYVSPGAIDNPKKPTVTVLGRFVNLGPHPFIQVDAGLNGADFNWTLAHECAHALGFPDERLCSQFADRFVKSEDDETAAGRARMFRDDLLQRARQQAVLEARARRQAVAVDGALAGRR